MPEIHSLGETAVTQCEGRRLRGQTLFYADAVIELREHFPVDTYCYRDDGFKGELLISRSRETLMSVEIKSEIETRKVSTKRSGRAFKPLRDKIHSLSCLHRNGQAKGWLSFLAQCWDYMANRLPSDLASAEYANREDLLVIPFDKETELDAAVTLITTAHSACQVNAHRTIRNQAGNITVLIYQHDALYTFFRNIQAIQI